MTKRTQKQPPNPDLLTRLLRNVWLAMRLVFDRRVSGTVKMIPLLTLLYIISPIDLVPDLLLPFGVVDDLGAFMLGLDLFIRNAPPTVVKEYRTGEKQPAIRTETPRANTSNTGASNAAAPQIIEGEYEVRDDR